MPTYTVRVTWSDTVHYSEEMEIVADSRDEAIDNAYDNYGSNGDVTDTDGNGDTSAEITNVEDEEDLSETYAVGDRLKCIRAHGSYFALNKVYKVTIVCSDEIVVVDDTGNDHYLSGRYLERFKPAVAESTRDLPAWF